MKTPQTYKEQKEQKEDKSSQKQLILNNFVNEILQLPQLARYNNILFKPKQSILPSTKINFLQFFDLLIWLEKRKPETLLELLQMDILKIPIKSVSNETISYQIKAYIVLINNCRVNGDIINYLLVNYLVDEVISKYLKSIAEDKNIQIQEKLQYLGSLLKAYNVHLNSKTFRYYMSAVRDKKKNKVKTKQVKQKQFKNRMNEFSLLDQQGYQQYNKNKSQTQEQVQKECLLIKICCRFYNCPQQLTKITVMNILMNILNQPFASEMIYNQRHFKLSPVLQQWSYNICCQFRNSLKDFNQQLGVIKQSQHDYIIEQINDKIIFWEDLTRNQHKQIYRQNFLHLIIDALIVGSLNMSSLPLFNIKFTFFILYKMLKILINLDLFKQIGKLLFSPYKIQYLESWVSTALMKGFNIEKITDDEYQSNEHLHQDIQKNIFQGTNQFFLNMLKSKDEQFLKISLNLLQQIIYHTKTDNSHSQQQNQKYYYEQLNFAANSSNLINITSILISQLKFDHSISTLKLICENLIFIQPTKYLSQDNSNEFVYFFSEFITDTLENIQKAKQYQQYVVQTFEYDMKILQLIRFNPKPIKDKQLLIHPSQLAEEPIYMNKINNNPKNSFYNVVPDIPKEMLRYRIVKAFLLLKLKEKVIQQVEIQSSSKFLSDFSVNSSKNLSITQSTFMLTDYVKKLQEWQKKQTKPGDVLSLPIKSRLHQCSLIQDKTQIPCVLIQDDVYLTIGFADMKGVKIMVNAKFKHVNVELFNKKDKVYIKVNLHKFDFQTENIVQKGSIMLRNLQLGVQYFAVKKENFRQKQINSIRKGLKRTQQSLPSLSLL